MLSGEICAVHGENTRLVIPGLFMAVHNSRSETPSGVDAGAGDRNGGQVDHEHRESNRKRNQNLCQGGKTSHANPVKFCPNFIDPNSDDKLYGKWQRWKEREFMSLENQNERMHTGT